MDYDTWKTNNPNDSMNPQNEHPLICENCGSKLSEDDFELCWRCDYKSEIQACLN